MSDCCNLKLPDFPSSGCHNDRITFNFKVYYRDDKFVYLDNDIVGKIISNRKGVIRVRTESKIKNFKSI